MDENKDLNSLQSDSPSRQLTYEYKEGNDFRAIHAQGVWGGITPHLNIYMALWTEQLSLPKQAIYDISPEGFVGPEVQGKSGDEQPKLIREVQAGVTIDLPTAKVIIDWLQQRIDVIESIVKQHSDDEES